MSRPTAPWCITDGAGDGVDLVAEWRLEDKSYESVFQQAHKRTVFRTLLKLNEVAHEVRALDREYTVSWEVDGPKLHLAASWFRGQKQSISYGTPVFYTERLPSGETVDYRFEPREVKAPIQQEVTASGWTYKGIVFGKL